jgi:hypothetical protein
MQDEGYDDYPETDERQAVADASRQNNRPKGKNSYYAAQEPAQVDRF